MRVPATVLLLAAVAGCARVEPGDDRLPAPLREITLVEDHPTTTPVRFSHALHADARAMGRFVACAECHHTLADGKEEVPSACATCHEPVYMAERVDEAGPHDHAGPPDL